MDTPNEGAVYVEQKRFDKKNLVVIAALVALIAVVALVATLLRPKLEPVQEGTKAYLVVTVAGGTYEPIPLTEEGRYTITRGEMVNVIAVTPDSVWMHSSNCEGQDCVLQGTVSLANRNDRVLQNMVLCLPNEIVLELLTEEEARRDYPNAFVTEAADE
jgi:hypothetical protein